jgi:hypothetical protein
MRDLLGDLSSATVIGLCMAVEVFNARAPVVDLVFMTRVAFRS